MLELTDFQEVVGMALDISDELASTMPKAWPNSERELRTALKAWRITTGSGVSGRDLLMACSEVWKMCPTDQSTNEGREIFYHPLDGTPIQAGSPMDEVPEEMLVFLRWSIGQSYLVWLDGVTIMREIKEAGYMVDDLPADRFPGKYSIPRLGDGSVDLGSLDVAKAKHFIRNGREQETLTADHWQQVASEFTLEGVLCSMTSLRSLGTRNRLLRNLPPGPVGMISRSSAPGTDMYNIVEAVRGFGLLNNGAWAINVLIDNAIELCRGTEKARKLEGFKKE